MITDKDKLIEIFESQFEEFVDIKNKKVLHSFVTLLIDNLVYQREFETYKHQTSSEIRLLIENVEKGFERMDRRFESVDKRFESLVEAMNIRFEAVNKRFEAVDKRFEDLVHYMDKRFNVTQWLIGILFVATNAMIVIMKLFL